MITENDNHWMPELYDGEMTDEVLQKKIQAKAHADEMKAKMLKVFEEKKKKMRNETNITAQKLVEA